MTWISTPRIDANLGHHPLAAIVVLHTDQDTSSWGPYVLRVKAMTWNTTRLALCLALTEQCQSLDRRNADELNETVPAIFR